jgi:phage terminase large subunit-like protein
MSGCGSRRIRILGVSKNIDDMRRLAGQAREMPTKLNAFLRLHLNVWTQASQRWISPDKWGSCGERPLPDLRGRRCCLGLDLATTTDVCALVAVFPPAEAGEPYWVSAVVLDS